MKETRVEPIRTLRSFGGAAGDQPTSCEAPVAALVGPPVKVHITALPLIRWGLQRMLDEERSRFNVATAASSVRETLPLLVQHNPDVLLLDFDCAEGIGGVRLLQAHTRAKLLVLAATQDQILLDRAVIAGVRGWVHKHEPPQVLFKAIEKVQQGEFWIDRAAIGRVFLEMAKQNAAEPVDAESSKIAALTVRERQTIAAVTCAASAPGKVIAQRLCISEHTLRNHLTSIYRKLELRNRVDLHDFAGRHNLGKAP
jgi:two-component system nitrate/nitrite response regulator NarL